MICGTRGSCWTFLWVSVRIPLVPDDVVSAANAAGLYRPFAEMKKVVKSVLLPPSERSSVRHDYRQLGCIVVVFQLRCVRLLYLTAWESGPVLAMGKVTLLLDCLRYCVETALPLSVFG